MEEFKGFMSGLEDLGFERVVVDVECENKFVSLRDLKDEITTIGIKDVVDTYWEDFSFIANSGNLVEIHAFY